MPSQKYSKILPTHIMDLINNFLKPHKSEYIFKFDDCLEELESINLIVHTYYNLNDNITYNLLQVLKNQNNRFLLKKN